MCRTNIDDFVLQGRIITELHVLERCCTYEIHAHLLNAADSKIRGGKATCGIIYAVSVEPISGLEDNIHWCGLLEIEIKEIHSVEFPKLLISSPMGCPYLLSNL